MKRISIVAVALLALALATAAATATPKPKPIVFAAKYAGTATTSVANNIATITASGAGKIGRAHV